MKKIILSAMISVQVLLLSAQPGVVNGTFEDTVIFYDPQAMVVDTALRHWSISDFGAGISSDAYSGSTAAYIWNWYYYAHGELTNGVASFSTGGGTPVSFSPEKMTGYYKYIAGEVQTSNDSALAIILLTKYNIALSKRDTIGFGIKKLGASNAYTAFEVPVEYRSMEAPDTLLVKFISSENGFCSNASAGNCLFLYVDDISVSNATGISEAVSLNDPVIFPNPATDQLNISFPGKISGGELKVFNTSGEKVLDEVISGSGIWHTDISLWPAGLYFVKTNDGSREYTSRLIKK